VVKTRDKLALPGPACNGRVSRGIPDQLSLLTCRQLPKVAQELEAPERPRQVGCAETPQHPQGGLQYGEEALRPMLMHVTPRIFLLGVVDEVVHRALERAIGARGVRLEPWAVGTTATA